MQGVNLAQVAEDAGRAWERSLELQGEFCSKRDYVAYSKARAQGLCRVMGGSGVVNGAQEVRLPEHPSELSGARFQLRCEQPPHAGPVRVIFSGAERGRIAGYGAVYGTLNRHRAKLEPGVFRDSLRTPLPMLWAHDHDKPIGSWNVLRETPYGLWAEGQINGSVAAGRDALELVRAADVTGLSVGFISRFGGYEEKDGVRIFKSGDLLEISVCPVPAEDLARITQGTGA